MCILLFIVTVSLPFVFGQEEAVCYSAGGVAGAAIGAFLGALILVAAVFYARKLYWRQREGKHLVFSTDPESVKDEFAFDNPGFKNEERRYWQNEAPTLPLGGKQRPLQAEFTKPEHTKDDIQLHRGRVRRVKLWARDFTGLGLRCGGGARDGVHIHSVLRSGPAAAALLQPGDRIKSIKIEFTGTPLEDAVSILSLASPYPVELEVIEGGRASGQGKGVVHPLLKKAGSTSDVNTLEKETKHLHPPRSPNSNNSTLESKQHKSIKKMITDIIPTTTLERKKERKDPPITTLERENEKNKKRYSDIPPPINKPVNKTRHSTGSDIQEIEQNEMQKRESDKKGMKFGIRVLPPNVPDDGVLRQKSVENGSLTIEKDQTDNKIEPATIDEVKKPIVKHEDEVKKPVVAKRREKMAPPIPNARTKFNDTEERHDSHITMTTFARNDLNSSGIRRDENGIPQELPQHMFEAAKAARSNRKSSTDLVMDKSDIKKEEAPKPPKKSKGKAPSPPEVKKNKSDDSILEQMNNVKDFLNNEQLHSSLLQDTVSVMTNTSTPKPKDESIKFSQEDIDDIIKKPFEKNDSLSFVDESKTAKRLFGKENDSLNNYYESKSNLSSAHDLHSVSDSEKTTTIELNNSDITIHSSPNETLRSVDESMLEENERKAASLGDLSRFELRSKATMQSTGTLERAQSLDISADELDVKENTLSPKKRKANSVVETTFYDSTEDTLPDMLDTEKSAKNKEPRLSLNMAKTTALDGLNTFQRNRLKKASEFGNLEDAIVKGSSSSVESESQDKTQVEESESSDSIAKRIMDENLKVHLKLVSEFAKSTSESDQPNEQYEEKTYQDINIPDDMKVSRGSYVNSLERPKSDMMKKLLAKNPILNVHVDQNAEEGEITPMTDASKTAMTQPDVVFNVNTEKQDNYEDFVSNIKVGSNNSLQRKENHSKDNVVMISTSDKTEPKSKYTSIEINDNRRLIPDVLEEIRKRGEEREARTLYMEPTNVAITMTEEPVQKTVTVNVAEDGFGNKVITQNVEKITKFTTKEAPLQIEQTSFGITKSQNIDELTLEEGDVKDIDKKVLEEIKKQNPNLHFTSEEPSYTKTETIILNTELEEKEALALMEKLKNDPSFIAQKTPEELSKLGIRIIRDLNDTKIEEFDTVEVTKTKYSINPMVDTDHVTEIQVTTPKIEKEIKKDKISSRQREEPLTYELDVDLLNDFIANERHHSSKDQEVKTKKEQKRHSDYDLPRNTSIQFRTATYESPKGTIVTSTDIENKRLSLLEQMQLRSDKPVLPAKPSNIPVKEKPKTSAVSSKIPVFMSQKSLSQENLNEKSFSLPRPQNFGSSGNVSVTSIIKSSSKNPSGKL